MSEFTAEEVRQRAEYEKSVSGPTDTVLMLDAYADSIERAEMGVPDEVVTIAVDALEEWALQGYTLSGDDVPRFRALADRIAPEVASAAAYKEVEIGGEAPLVRASPAPNWCPTCGKRPDDLAAHFACNDSFHKKQKSQRTSTDAEDAIAPHEREPVVAAIRRHLARRYALHLPCDQVRQLIRAIDAARAARGGE